MLKKWSLCDRQKISIKTLINLALKHIFKLFSNRWSQQFSQKGVFHNTRFIP